MITITDKNCGDYNIALGKDSKIICSQEFHGPGIKVGDRTIIAGDVINIGEGTSIGNGCDIRSGEIHIGKGSELANNVKLLVADEFRIGAASRISAGCNITCRKFTAGNFLYFAQDCHVGYGGTMESSSVVTLGNNIALGPHNILNANYEIRLDDNVGSGSYITMWTHGFHFGHSVLDGFVAEYKGIHVKENVWLGYHVTLLPGIVIGKNSIIASCAVVSKEIPPDCLAGGVPAKVLKSIVANPVEKQTSVKLVKDILHAWIEEINWKGFVTSAKDAAGCHLCVTVEDPQTHAITTVMYLEDGFMPGWTSGNHIFLSIDDNDELRTGLMAQHALLEFRSKRFTGASTPMAEDIRDYFRRRTLGCGTGKLYSSIEPFSFTRLKNLQL